MHVSTTVAKWRERRRLGAGRTIGFVPTMGALHRGHGSLIDRCRQENEIVVASLFVNPTQFNDPKDLERYPRTLDADLAMLEDLGTDEVFAPAASELYPNGYEFNVEVRGLADTMEGAHRPGFFQGVTTVVLKLLNLIQPDRAYFGEKDYQQLKIIEAMAADFFLPTTIIPCPTIREMSGLAQSSRNALLSHAARDRAASLYRALRDAASPESARTELESEGFDVDYVEEHWGRRLAAITVENVRLIDNVPLTNCASHASLP